MKKQLDYKFAVSELSIKYKSKVPIKERATLAGSDSMAKSFFSYWDKDTIELHEDVYAMMLNTNMKAMGLICVGSGSSTQSMVDIRRVAQAALLVNANAVALCHNHPSGNLKPSMDDRNITKKADDALRCLGIKLIDHIILSPDGDYYSFADEGLL